jgi:hypothetical protein
MSHIWQNASSSQEKQSHDDANLYLTQSKNLGYIIGVGTRGRCVTFEDPGQLLQGEPVSFFLTDTPHKRITRIKTALIMETSAKARCSLHIFRTRRILASFHPITATYNY